MPNTIQGGIRAGRKEARRLCGLVSSMRDNLLLLGMRRRESIGRVDEQQWGKRTNRSLDAVNVRAIGP